MARLSAPIYFIGHFIHRLFHRKHHHYHYHKDVHLEELPIKGGSNPASPNLTVNAWILDVAGTPKYYTGFYGSDSAKDSDIAASVAEKMPSYEEDSYVFTGIAAHSRNADGFILSGEYYDFFTSFLGGGT